MPLSPRKITIVILTLLLFLTSTVYFFNKEINRPKLPAINKVKDFTLVDKDNQVFSSAQELNGRVWIADFIFTTCGGVCPIMTKNMANLSRSFKLAKGIKLVSISVNPETDTPEVLKKYADLQDAGEDKWYFLTGKREDIHRLAVDSFKLGSIEDPVFHSAYFTLVDRNGYIRGYYDGTKTEEINRLFKDTSLLMRER